jgi:hypothetical protein
VTGDLLAAAWIAADPLGGSPRERIQGCQLCCLGLEACFGLSLLGADTGQIGLQLPKGGRHMGQDAGEREYRRELWMIQFQPWTASGRRSTHGRAQQQTGCWRSLRPGDTVVFAGDNGPEEVLWRGTPGYWEGSYFAGGEGNLRTPCIVRWPGNLPGRRVSDEIMHVTDWFTTLLHAAGVPEPTDRVIRRLFP